MHTLTPSYAAMSLPAIREARIGIVHDWLPVYAGAERVLEQMLYTFPQAEVYSLLECLPPDQRAFLQGKNVHTSFIQRLPFVTRIYRWYLPLMPLAIEQLDMRAYDIILSSNYVVAKGVLTNAHQLHISYIHSPVRYAWDLYFQYLETSGIRQGLKGLLARIILHYLRLYDTSTASRVDYFIANSRYVARRIWKTYRRKARVIYPPVDTSRFRFTPTKGDYYLTVSRLVPYKRVDLIVQAFAHLPDKELIVIGDGPELDRLQSIATPNVRLLGYQPAETLRYYLEHAKAFIFAAEEDFGIAPVEAQACGTPVIAFGRGGVLETVIPGKTGFFFYEQSVPALLQAIRQFERHQHELEPEVLRAHAEQFSAERFREELARTVEEAWTLFEQGQLENAA